MVRAPIDWMDPDWSSRGYDPVFALGHRLVWGVPVFLSLAVIAALEGLGFPPDGPVILSVLALGVAGMLAIMLVSSYRWAAGYSRSEFQEWAAAEHRERVSARQAFFRWLHRPNGS